MSLPGSASSSSAVAAIAPLASHDLQSLGELLARATGRELASARRTAGQALRAAFGGDSVAPEWSVEALTRARIGRWAQPALLGLSPEPCLRVVEQAASDDGTIRVLLAARDGELIESVLIPAPSSRIRPRTTLCISSQVGCARACRFCESGRHGLRRQLGSAEIVDQFRLLRALWAEHPAGGAISNLVFMGMGEPFDNLLQVTRALHLLCDERAFALPPSHVTVSTVGIADKLGAFFQTTRAEIAISLNAPDDARRTAIIPAAARFDLRTLRETLLATLPPRRRVLFQYALFAGFNDALGDADLLADYVRPVFCRVNVIAGNPGPDPGLRSPPPDRVEAFAERLRSRGVTTIIRRARGRDVGAACGQLSGAYRARHAQAPPA
jgi:23S rRNA (adenine2503-C2)-methyltransferase